MRCRQQRMETTIMAKHNTRKRTPEAKRETLRRREIRRTKVSA